jgi:putative tricarboxylic transport membrane protein
LDLMVSGLSMVFLPENLFWAAVGVAFGMIMGAIPGLTDTMAIVLLMPFTFYLEPIAGIAMLMGLCKGGNFGGSIPAILFNIPGTPQAMVTCLDGYPLTKQGKSGKALRMALFSSTIADTASDLILIFLAGPVAMIALKIGPPEYTSIVIFSLLVISTAATDNPLRGMVATGLGLLLGAVGTDPGMGTTRLIFGYMGLADGFSIMSLVIGMLAFSEVLLQMEKSVLARLAGTGGMTLGEAGDAPVGGSTKADNRVNFREFRKGLPSIGRGTVIGACIGIIPGIGTTVGSYLAYIASKRASKTPEMFGNGALEGLAAAEAGNNAVNGPNLVPLVTLGIPGNLAAALILGGFMMKGLIPGPMFMKTNGDMLYALFTLLLLSNVFTLGFGLFFIRHVRHVTKVAKPYLFSGIVVFSVIGSYTYAANVFDVFVMVGFGLLGYVLTKCRINLPTVIVAYFLGPLLETNLRHTLSISGGDWTVFVTRPISVGFLIFAVVAVCFLLRHRRPLN